MPSTCPFKTLSISPNSTEKQVLHAWRRLMRLHHPDKAEDSLRARELNAAKDACVLKICTDSQLNLEEEFVKHINTVLQEKSGLDFDMSNIIRPQLHSFMHIRAVDAMEWVILCAIGEVRNLTSFLKLLFENRKNTGTVSEKEARRDPDFAQVL